MSISRIAFQKIINNGHECEYFYVCSGNTHLGLHQNLRNTLWGIPNDINIRVLNLSDVGLTGALQVMLSFGLTVYL